MALVIWGVSGLFDDVVAEQRRFTLAVPAALVDSGLLRFIVPRFSLKNATRVEIVGEGADAVARLELGGAGRSVFRGPEGDWTLALSEGGEDGLEAARRFETWLTGEIGRNTVAAFEIDGRRPYAPVDPADAGATKIEIRGDSVKGERLAVRHCGRCHAVNAATQLTTIGSTPSFALLRGFEDWMRRFQSFYSLNPHPAFTLVAGVTPPFDITLPPPISPVRVSVDDIQSILAYVVTIEPADLGAPLQFK